MNRFSFKSAMTWVLFAAQAMTVSAGYAGLLVCREADGSSHVEWVSQPCCDDTHTESDAPREADAGSVSESCSDAACVDLPIASGKATTGSRARDSGAGLGSQVADVSHAVTWSGGSSPEAESPGLAETGAALDTPSQVRLSLRATVLIL